MTPDLRRVEDASVPTGDVSLPSSISGRERELKILQKAFMEAQAGRGRTVLIKGEPGIGKTTLAEAFSATARSEGANVLWGRAWEAGGAPAYWPWIQVLRGLIGLPEKEGQIESVRPFLDVVATLVPEVAGPGGAQRPQGEVGEQERFALFDAISRVLQACAETTPLVIVLDDFHAVEDSSLLLLRFVARDIRNSHCLILVTHRDQEVQADPLAREILAEVSREGEVVALSGLDLDSMAWVLEGAAGAPPSQALRDSLHQITEGNPFYANEIMRLLIEEGQIEARLDLTRRALPVPDSVSALVLRRMKNLGPEVRRLLSVAAVVGREFSAEVVSRAAVVSVSDLTASLEVASEEGILRSRGPGVYLFDHNLIREALYESLADYERSQTHGRVATALEELSSDATESLSEIAHHYLRASLDDARLPFDYAMRAGTRALDVLAFEQAVAFFEEALNLAPVAGSSQTEKAEVLVRLGEALLRAGRVPEASEKLKEAAGIAKEEGSSEMLVRAALAHAHVPTEGGIVDADLVKLFEEALVQLGSEDSFEKALLSARLASEITLSTDKEDVARKERLSAEAIEMVRRVGKPHEIALILRFCFTATFSPARLDESWALVNEMMQVGLSSDNMTQIMGRLRRCAILMSLGKFDELEGELKEAQRLAAEIRQPVFASPTAFLEAAIAAIRSDVPTALAQSDKALAEGSDVPNALGAHLLQHCSLRLETDGAADLEFFVRAVMEQRPGLRRAWGSGLINIFARTGRTAEARALLRDMIEDLPNSPVNLVYAPTVHFAVEAIRVMREPYGCDVLYEALIPYRSQHLLQMMLAPVAYYGSVERDLATLASILERWDAAEEHFERSLREHARIGARTFLAWTQAEYAEMMLRRGDPKDTFRAKELLEEADRSAETLGLNILQSFISPLLKEPAPAPKSESPSEGAPSFVREGEYVTIRCGDEVVRLKHTKGLTYLAQLLAHPGREVHVLEIASSGGPGTSIQTGELERASDDAGAALDPQAKAAYRRRIEDLREEIEEAERFNDPARRESAQAELDFITQEIAGAVGLGGRDRKTASNAERARVNVTKRIKETIAKIAADAPRLGKHLSAGVKTGTFLSYGEDIEPLYWTIES